MQSIGNNHGAESLRQFLRELDVEAPEAFAIDNVLGAPGTKYPDNSAPNTPVEGTLRKLIANSNEVVALNVGSRLAALEDAVARGPFG